MCYDYFKKGKGEEYDVVALPDGEMMKNPSQNEYKHLRALEAN